MHIDSNAKISITVTESEGRIIQKFIRQLSEVYYEDCGGAGLDLGDLELLVINGRVGSNPEITFDIVE